MDLLNRLAWRIHVLGLPGQCRHEFIRQESTQGQGMLQCFTVCCLPTCSGPRHCVTKVVGLMKCVVVVVVVSLSPLPLYNHKSPVGNVVLSRRVFVSIVPPSNQKPIVQERPDFQSISESLIRFAWHSVSFCQCVQFVHAHRFWSRPSILSILLQLLLLSLLLYVTYTMTLHCGVVHQCFVLFWHNIQIILSSMCVCVCVCACVCVRVRVCRVTIVHCVVVQ